MRATEKIGIEVFKRLNKIGLLISLKPLSVSVLAEKMIMESKLDKTVELKTYKPKDLI
jgi:hypothetical protein